MFNQSYPARRIQEFVVNEQPEWLIRGSRTIEKDGYEIFFYMDGTFEFSVKQYDDDDIIIEFDDIEPYSPQWVAILMSLLSHPEEIAASRQ